MGLRVLERGVKTVQGLGNGVSGSFGLGNGV